MKLNFRLPPTLNAKAANEKLVKLLTTDVPYNAKVTVETYYADDGWVVPEYKDWLYQAINESSEKYYNKKALYWGEGGSIPFLQVLKETFPKTQFIVTGVLGPASNAHGPNEFLHLEYTNKLI